MHVLQPSLSRIAAEITRGLEQCCLHALRCMGRE